MVGFLKPGGDHSILVGTAGISTPDTHQRVDRRQPRLAAHARASSANAHSTPRQSADGGLWRVFRTALGSGVSAELAILIFERSPHPVPGWQRNKGAAF